MDKRYGFHIDTSSCSGCKTCQVACKDKNDLHEGQHWRKVVEIEGGNWERTGEAWSEVPFGYYISMSCNHCEDPSCVKACPTTAMHAGGMGVVLVDKDKCMGCGYCIWACPYDAPKMDPEKGRMSKCDFCHDRLENGGRPVCVESCPMRALDFDEYDILTERYGRNRDIFPLAGSSLTRPRVTIKVHMDAEKAGEENASISNSEEL